MNAGGCYHLRDDPYRTLPLGSRTIRGRLGGLSGQHDVLPRAPLRQGHREPKRFVVHCQKIEKTGRLQVKTSRYPYRSRCRLIYFVYQ